MTTCFVIQPFDDGVFDRDMRRCEIDPAVSSDGLGAEPTVGGSRPILTFLAPHQPKGDRGATDHLSKSNG